MIAAPIRAASIAGVPVDDVTMTEAVDTIAAFVDEGRRTGRTFQVATVNVDFVVNAREDASVFSIMQQTDLSIADGRPILWLASISGTPLRERVAGADLVPLLAELAATNGWRILLFGSKDGVAESASALLLARARGAIIRGMSGPFLTNVADMPEDVLDEIRAFAPDIICVALGNPKQERWIEAHRHTVGASVLIGVGGTLDFLVGGRRRAPGWMQRIGLEWVYRALQEPKRLGRRYAHDIWVFTPLIAGAVVERVRTRKGTRVTTTLAESLGQARDARRRGS